MKINNIPLEIIEKWLADDDWRVRVAAINALRSLGLPVPLIRTFKPPSKVYKKCIGGVIVEAEIPHYAHVNGSKNQKCRASHAIITDVIGDLHGLKIGISLHDQKTAYSVGDIIEIEDYCFSDNECAAGFHFFNTLEEAENYEN